jgi:hypothetical protein
MHLILNYDLNEGDYKKRNTRCYNTHAMQSQRSYSRFSCKSFFYHCDILRHSLEFICKLLFTARQFFQQIFIHVLNNAYCTVYCINKVHKRVEILDPQN